MKKRGQRQRVSTPDEVRMNYVVPCWSGPRRIVDNFYDSDTTLYLKAHLHALSNVKCNLSQITFVINHNPNEPDGFRQFIEGLPQEINEIPLVVLRRPTNQGFTFGAWSYVYKLYGNDFSHYLYGEDDYAPVMDHFDHVFLNYLNLYKSQGRRPGFVCPKTCLIDRSHGSLAPFLYNLPQQFHVPIFAIGMIPAECLAVLANRYDNEVPYPRSDQYPDVDGGFTFHSIVNEGYTIEPIPDHSVVVLLHATNGGVHKRIGYFGTYNTGPTLFVPVQYTHQYNVLIGHA